MAYNSSYTGPEIDSAIGAVKNKEKTWDSKQDKLNGTEDQLVGFNASGEAAAVPMPSAADVGADPAGKAEAEVVEHNSSGDAHSALFAEKQDKITGQQGQIVGFDNTGKPVAQNNTASGVTFSPGSTGMSADNVQAAVTELFTSVSDGKSAVAAAITDKGVTTAADATFQQMAANIGQIQTGTDTSDATATAGDILSGKTAYGAAGKLTGTIPSQNATTITPGTTAKTAIAAGTYAAGAATVAGDANLVAGNIKEGVSIFGVTGSFAGGAELATVTISLSGISPSSYTISYVNESYGYGYQYLDFMSGETSVTFQTFVGSIIYVTATGNGSSQTLTSITSSNNKSRIVGNKYVAVCIIDGNVTISVK